MVNLVNDKLVTAMMCMTENEYFLNFLETNKQCKKMVCKDILLAESLCNIFLSKITLQRL